MGYTNSNKSKPDFEPAKKEVLPKDLPKKTHVFRIKAKKLCWLSAQMDDQIKDVYLRPGEKLRLEFRQDLTLKLGNAGGIKLWYDGENYPLDADLKEVKVIKLP